MQRVTLEKQEKEERKKESSIRVREGTSVTAGKERRKEKRKRCRKGGRKGKKRSTDEEETGKIQRVNSGSGRKNRKKRKAREGTRRERGKEKGENGEGQGCCLLKDRLRFL